VLSDPQKREMYVDFNFFVGQPSLTIDRYDTRGEAGLQEGPGMGGMDPQDLFSSLFGGAGGFFGGGGGGRSRGPRKTKDLVHHISVSLEDLYKGKTSKLALTRHVICAKCNGKGGKEGAVKKCMTCHGSGTRTVIRQLGPMIQQFQQSCGECEGTGEIVNPKDKCKTCNGKKVTSEKKFLEIHIDKGMKGGQHITFPGESDQAPDIESGDVIIVIDEKQHDRFKRQDNDLYTEVEIDLLTALGGGQFGIKHLDDRALIVNLVRGEVIKHGMSTLIPFLFPLLRNLTGVVKVIQGQGMPSQRHHEPGDMYVQINVKFPESVDPAVVPKLEAALPPRTPLPKYPKSTHIEEVGIHDMDARQQRAHASHDSMDEDDPHGEPRVQCAQQ
jgi:DnaJ homolog subfamily A member 2